MAAKKKEASGRKNLSSALSRVNARNKRQGIKVKPLTQSQSAKLNRVQSGLSGVKLNARERQGKSSGG